MSKILVEKLAVCMIIELRIMQLTNPQKSVEIITLCFYWNRLEKAFPSLTTGVWKALVFCGRNCYKIRHYFSPERTLSLSPSEYLAMYIKQRRGIEILLRMTTVWQEISFGMWAIWVEIQSLVWIKKKRNLHLDFPNS